jgi:hypothetical protein
MKIKIKLVEYASVKQVTAVKCKHPRMTDIHGRTWDLIGNVVGGNSIYADTTWGCYGYFYDDNNHSWYKFNFAKFEL